MCKKIRIKKKEYNRKNVIPHYFGQSIWNGDAELENLDAWLQDGWKITLINKVTSYEEKKHSFKRKGFICAIYKNGEVKIVTRTAQTYNEKAIHDRHPKMIK